MRRRVLACALTVLLTAPGARAADRFVSRAGSDTTNDCTAAGNPCRTISRAIAQASSGDTVNVTAGTYSENPAIEQTTNLTFLGGWDAGFTTRAWNVTPTIVRSGRVDTGPFLPKRDRVWSVRAADASVAIDLVLDGFVLMKGYATSNVPLPRDVRNDHWEDGGGLAATARGGSITLTVRNALITKNRALIAGGGVAGHAFNGGTLDLVLDNVTMTKNRAQGGGGVTLAATNGIDPVPSNQLTARLVNSVIAQNRAEGVIRPDLDNEVFLGGGAIWIQTYNTQSTLALDIVDSTITRNQAGLVAGINLLIDGVSGNGAVVNLLDTILPGCGEHGSLGRLLDQTRAALTVSADHSDLGARTIVAGTFSDLGGNLDVDPSLTSGLALEAGSPLIDAGTCAGAAPTDRDGDPRPSGAGCDIGADEFVP